MKLITPFGYPGSGKGTQTANIVAEPMFGVLASLVLGDVFRRIQKQDPHGTIGLVMGMGGLIPDEIVNPMLVQFFRNNIGKSTGTGYESLVVDGWPRNGNQARLLPGHLRAFGITEAHILNIEVPPTVCRDRMIKRAQKASGGHVRLDDSKVEVIEERIAAHGVAAAHILPFLREQEDVYIHDIDGEVPGLMVFDQIKTKLGLPTPGVLV